MRVGGPYGRQPPQRPRSQVLAIQAVAVVALLVVAFVLFLRPGDDTPLFGIGAPDPRPPFDSQVGGPPGGDGERGEPAREPGTARPPGGPPGATATAVAGLPSASTAVAPDLAPSPPGPGGPGGAGGPSGGGGQPSNGGGTPADDQYDDAVARIESNLR